MKKNKKVTLHKANELTRGGDGLSVHAKRCLNAIYYIVQKNLEQGINKRELEIAEFITISFPFLRKMMHLEKTESYIKEIEDALKELQETTIQLNNFKHPKTGKVFQWYSMSFLSDTGWKLENGKKMAYISIAPLMKWIMINTHTNGNFTELELIPIVNKLKTKYAMKIYEYLKSFETYKFLDITQKHLMKLLGFEEDHKTYKHYSKLKTLLNRQLKEIANKTDLKEVRLIDNSLLAKEKKYRIVINPKGKNKSVSQKEVKETIDKLLQKFKF